MTSILGFKKPPPPQPPARMPDPESPDVVEARRREIGKRLESGGRTSTILTGGAPAGGGGFDSYASDKL
jgi:hypothetical protein